MQFRIFQLVMQIPFVNLKRETNLIKNDLLHATEEVLSSGIIFLEKS